LLLKTPNLLQKKQTDPHFPTITFHRFESIHPAIMDANISSSPAHPPPFDIIILGASGFTGKYVIREALKFLNSQSSPLKSLALAGRNPSKLSQALKWATSSQSHPNSSPSPPIPILSADTTDPSSLRLLCSQTKLLLNCVGPFRLYGDPVVAACAQTGCDYLDICGEPEFMERMELNYHDQAVLNGSLVVSACGFDSVPAELGWMFNSKQWRSPAVPNQIEAYLSLESDRNIVGNFGTYESAVLGVANMDKLIELRRSRPRRPKPTKGPSEDEVASASFKMWFVGRGYSNWNEEASEENKKKKPDAEIITRVMGPEIGYVTTPIVLLQCALILLGQRDSLPKGGVLTPGIVFGPTDLQERLQQNGISFDVISRKNVPTA
ncbi:Probable mitochondrial saccharopine dehydrogenase-like oxidoreductase At5g39410, partial [Linum perenne]